MRISVKMKPGSKKGPSIEISADGSLIVYVREAAIDGKANSALVRLLSDYYHVPKTRIKIIRGLTSRLKMIDIG